MKIEFSSQRREMLLFLTTNMAAVTSRANQQYAHRSILKKYVFLLHVLNEKENIVNAGYWVLSENRKNYFLSKKTQCVLS